MTQFPDTIFALALLWFMMFLITTANIAVKTPEFWLNILVCALLITFAGVLNGLQRGLLSIEPLNLAILELEGGDREARHAKKLGGILKVNTV